VPEYFSLRVRGAARPERLAYCRLRLTASVLAHRLQMPEMDELRVSASTIGSRPLSLRNRQRPPQSTPDASDHAADPGGGDESSARPLLWGASRVLGHLRGPPGHSGDATPVASTTSSPIERPTPPLSASRRFTVEDVSGPEEDKFLAVPVAYYDRRMLADEPNADIASRALGRYSAERMQVEHRVAILLEVRAAAAATHPLRC
jgi:hypothetical protein